MAPISIVWSNHCQNMVNSRFYSKNRCHGPNLFREMGTAPISAEHPMSVGISIYIYIFFFLIFDVLVNYYHYPWLVYVLSKTIFLGDPIFQCNLFTSSSRTNEIFTNLLYDLTPYHIYKKIFV